VASGISKKIIQEDPWHSLRSFTHARIALGKTGVAIPLQEVLALKLAHAYARDTVFSELDIDNLTKDLQSLELPVYLLNSLVANRIEYLQRPDLGRRLDEISLQKTGSIPGGPFDIALVLTDGLSASAVNVHAVPLLKRMLELSKKYSWSFAPVTLVQQGRVAIADEIGFLLKARLTIILVGERPGLTTTESLGAYITYNPQPGLTDEKRNCISNIHPGGLHYDIAAEKIMYLARTAIELKLSGINLKEDNNLLL